MQARYRSDYAGEFVVTETRWSGGRKQQQREWVANPIENHHISHRAACIGTMIDQHLFDYTRLQRHRGGLLSSKKLQTYGTGRIAEQMRLDFAIETNAAVLQTLIDNGYASQNILYTTAKNCVAIPGEFYLIPYNQNFLTEITPVYLAAFDGHEEIFLLGYNNDSPIDNANWTDQLAKIFAAYAGTKFYLVGESTNMQQSLFDLANVTSMSYRAWISYCDV